MAGDVLLNEDATKRLLEDSGLFLLEEPVYTDAVSGTLTFSGSGIDALVYADATAGTLVFSGTQSDALAYTDAIAGSLVFTGTQSDVFTVADATAGTLFFTGSAVESTGGPTYVDTGAGTLLFTGSAVDAASTTDSQSGTLVFTGSKYELHWVGTIPETHPDLGGFPVETLRGGTPDATLTGALLAGPTGANYDQQLTNGSVTEPKSGGVFSEVIRSATLRTPNGAVAFSLTGGSVTTTVRGGSPNEMNHGGYFDEAATGGAVDETLTGADEDKLIGATPDQSRRDGEVF